MQPGVCHAFQSALLFADELVALAFADVSPDCSIDATNDLADRRNLCVAVGDPVTLRIVSEILPRTGGLRTAKQVRDLPSIATNQLQSGVPRPWAAPALGTELEQIVIVRAAAGNQRAEHAQRMQRKV